MTAAGDSRRARLAPLLGRRSVPPKRLGPPAPDAEAVDLALEAALRAPDHGGLTPWRVIAFAPDDRERLADQFVAEKRRRDPAASEAELARAREHALGPPALFAFVVRLDAPSPVPAHERWLAAGAALGALLSAFDLLGFGASVLSGARCADPALAAALGVAEGEQLVGFVGVGTAVQPPKPAAVRPVERVLGRWSVG